MAKHRRDAAASVNQRLMIIFAQEGLLSQLLRHRDEYREIVEFFLCHDGLDLRKYVNLGVWERRNVRVRSCWLRWPSSQAPPPDSVL